MNVNVFCNLVEIYGRFEGTYCTVSTSETSVNFYDNKGQNVPEDSHIHTIRMVTFSAIETMS
jgi:hypothetical protein